jgi:DNA replication and repair protein RecF
VLTAIDIENFRCIERAHLDFDGGATGIVGDNASGKTSLLEAIYFLGHGRSFRTNRRDKLVRRETPFFRVVGRVETGGGAQLVAGIEYVEGATRASLAGQGVSGIAELAEVLPIQVIDPGAHRLIEEGSARRRRLMDWGVFHVKHDFLGCWRRYQRALQQRNAALKAHQPLELIDAWEPELCAAGTAVDERRAAYAAGLQPFFEALANRLIGAVGARFVYRRGWANEQGLVDALREARPRDLRLRTTTAGPHRADLSFVMGNGTAAARDYVSRGQQKMLAAAFVLAQLAYRASLNAPVATLMLDDPAAELDVDNLGKLLRAVAEIPCQLIVTSVHERGLRGIELCRMFHVKQGSFTPGVIIPQPAT